MSELRSTSTFSRAEPEPERLLRGAKEIADFLGLRPKAVYTAAERGVLPIIRLPGAGLVARPSALRERIAQLEAAALRGGAGEAA